MEREKEYQAEGFSGILHPVETQRASEAIYEQIKQLIVEGQLKPGDRLPSERSMMTMLQRSRPTIREALRMLERAGFIRTVPGTNGAVVQELGTDGVEQSLEVVLQTSRVTLDELTEYRAQNDTAVARWAALRHTRADIAALNRLLTEAAVLVESREFEEFVARDVDFHSRLAKAGKNEVAYVMAKVISKLSAPIMLHFLHQQTEAENLDMCTRILAMHRKIYEAVRLGDADAAEAAMDYHIQVFHNDLNQKY